MPSSAVHTTGHCSRGRSIFIESEPCKALTPALGVLYRAVTQPDGLVDTAADADLRALSHLTPEDSNDVPERGFVVVAAEWPPGADRRDVMHRLDSVCVGVMVEGEVEVHLDSGEYRTLRVGDVLIQRGTKHTWLNPSFTDTARMISFVMPSRPTGVPTQQMSPVSAP